MRACPLRRAGHDCLRGSDRIPVAAGGATMARLVTTLMMIAAGIGLSACQSAQQTVQNKEDLLAAAGFTIQPANSPARIAEMKRLPPHKFVRQTSGNTVVYLFADPSVCQCVYFGDQAAWSAYRSMVFEKQLVNQQQMIALVNPGPFDFGPWDPGFW
jgi:hypothetical protein